MSTLYWIIGSSLLGGALSVAVAAIFAFAARPHWVPMLVSYAIGALLGAVFLEILPHAFEVGRNIHAMTATLLFGILTFFILEKLVLWRHCHHETCEAHGAQDDETDDGEHGHIHAPVPARNAGHEHDHGRSGLMIMVGDTFHNFVDGVLIAAAFVADFQLGVVTALAIIAHEIPQEVGDFLILLHSGYSKAKALLFNLVSSVATIIGGVLGYLALASMQGWVPYILALAAASMIYVAVADLIPGLHKRPELAATVQQVTLIGLGIGSIWLTERLLGGLV
jgi:zinc and cadmium transporter